ncbi:TIM-barrel domain-containing protein [Paludisphaera rhizosphaerae]|uniref:TIM-barrel domain-containing protein n=1 Tax=Paludisphaera rhizosphaerae TaxID=2711216 RepID=UPI0013EC0890|nr:TIM-barrel domain-containing protein [Paludisphaera rhizosphaerae]
MPHQYVYVHSFTPNNGDWKPIGDIVNTRRTGDAIDLDMSTPGMSLRVSFLGPTCFRVRFRPVVTPDYTTETSFAVVERDLTGGVPLSLVVNKGGDHLDVDTGSIQVRINLKPYGIQVFRGGQLISADMPGYNLVYIPFQEVVANFKTYPANARYCGFGSKAGAQLFKNEFTMTFFNFDNFSYNSAPALPESEGNNPLNPSEPLYCSVPLLLEVNPSPIGDFAGDPYAYGVFFDNPAQSYFNIGASDYSDMYGKYYFGALYGEMDYYFMAGDDVRGVLAQYTTLTGRSPMPPKYVFGFHQGAYGYFDSATLSAAANGYRAAAIPLDGLHIDVDFQDNYRTFTHSEIKFPNAARYLSGLHDHGFKCSTNITPLLTDNMFDEKGDMAAYDQLQAMNTAGGLLASQFFPGEDPAPSNPDPLFLGDVSYGDNFGSNTYFTAYPPKVFRNGSMALGAQGRYSDYSRAKVRKAWGRQYKHLIQDLKMDMIWQDMTCPALNVVGATQPKTFPLSLMQNPDAGPPVPNAVIHNAYALTLLIGTWDGIQTLRSEVADKTRNFIIARGGYAGMQRYAGLWTGDSPSSWDYLRVNVPQVLNLGLSGIPINGADIGGFATGSGSVGQGRIEGSKVVGQITNYELFTRWMHAGAFLPWFRNHYNGYVKEFQEAFRYQEPVPTNCRKYVELRYRLLQLFYDAMFEWTQTGVPVSRALFVNDPHDPNVYDPRWADSEFFVGRDLLIAPIIEQHETASPPSPPIRQVYLPARSDWYSFKDNRAKLEAPVTGGIPAFDYFAPLDLVPIYVRAGAILPTRELEQYVGQLPQNPLTLNIYPGPDSSYRLYLDDGITTDAAENEVFRITEVSHKSVAGGQEIRVHRLKDGFTPREPFYFIALPGTRRPSTVSVGGAALPDVGSPENLTGSAADAYYWNPSIEVTFIKVFDSLPDVTVTALFL